MKVLTISFYVTSLGVVGLFIAWLVYHRSAHAAVHREADNPPLAWWRSVLWVGMVGGSAVVLWLLLDHWRAALAVLVGALGAAIARALMYSLGSNRRSSLVAGLTQGSLLLLGAGSLYLLIGFRPDHLTDFTGFAWGAILSSLLIRSGDWVDWFQPLAGVLVAAFGVTAQLDVGATMWMGPQARLLLLPLALVSTGFLCSSLSMGVEHTLWPAARVVLAVCLFLAVAFGLMVYLNVYWQLWLCLAAGVALGHRVLWLKLSHGMLEAATTIAAVILTMAIAAWLVPGHAYGIAIAAVGTVAGFVSYPAWQQVGAAASRLNLVVGWLASLLLSYVSLQYVSGLSNTGQGWSLAHWALAVLPALTLLGCLLLLPLLLNACGIWTRTKLQTLCSDPACRIAQAQRLQLYLGLSAAGTHLLALGL